MKKSIIFTKTSIATGNVIELQEFSSKQKALKFYNEQVDGDGLVKSEEVATVNGKVVRTKFQAIPSKYGMNQDYRYELEISTI